jgi:hypothetical protein
LYQSRCNVPEPAYLHGIVGTRSTQRERALTKATCMHDSLGDKIAGQDSRAFGVPNGNAARDMWQRDVGDRRVEPPQGRSRG